MIWLVIGGALVWTFIVWVIARLIEGRPDNVPCVYDRPTNKGGR